MSDISKTPMNYIPIGCKGKGLVLFPFPVNNIKNNKQK